MVRRRRRVRLDSQAVIGLAGLGVVAIGGAWWRATSIVNRLLSDWAVGAVAQQSNGVYRLDPVGVHVHWLLRRVTVDSIRLTTNGAANVRQPVPLADVRIGLVGCTISGVHVVRLIRGAGLAAGSLGCAAGAVAVQLPRRARDSTPAPPPRSGHRAGFLVLQKSLRLPSYAPTLHIRQITFPDLAFDFRLPHGRTGETRLELERLQWHMTDFVIDPADAGAASRPLFSRTIDLVASSFVARPDSAFALRVGLLRASLTDSTIEARDVGAEIRPSPTHHRDLIRIVAGRTLAQGIDFGAFAFARIALARRIEVDSFGIDVTSDERLPRDRNPGRDRTPQQWIADLDMTIGVDSVVAERGEVVYREQKIGRARPGVMTFAGIQATAVNLIHRVDRTTGVDTMLLATTARLQDAAPLQVQFAVPLDAPQFDMAFHGTLGPMPATALNPFIEEVLPLRIADGMVQGITFGALVRGGVARGRITPRFTDLALSVTRGGSGGILGGGGVIGGAARGIASIMANWGVRSSNPENPTRPPHSGRVFHAFRSNETLPAFLWASLRGGLLEVMKP